MINNYWVERQRKAQENLTNKSIKQTEAQLKKYYKSAMDNVINEFEQTIFKLNSAIQNGKQPTPADLYKLDKYWQLQAQLRDELYTLGEKQAALFSKKFEQQYMRIYKMIALPDTDKSFSNVDLASARQMINQIWCADGKSWSQRIWTNTEKLQQALNDNLINCVASGKKTTQLKQMLQHSFQVGYSRADSIVRTEMAHIQTQAAQQRYKDSGIEQVEIWVDPDERTCDICGELHENRYSVFDDVPIPAHTNCRCCIIPVVESLD